MSFVRTKSGSTNRREFLQIAIAAAGSASFGSRTNTARAAMNGDVSKLVAGIERSVVFNGRNGGGIWFHPRPARVPTGGVPQVLMTQQSISGSDVFGPVHWTLTSDLGKTWSNPVPIDGLGRRELDEPDWQVGVCDVVPEFHAATGKVLAVGHNVYYLKGVLGNPQKERWPVYTVRDKEGRWSEPKRLEWNDERGSAIYSCGCSQRVNLAGGDVLVPLTYGPKGRTDRMVTSTRCSFDGETLAIQQVGNELVNHTKRGLLEPSLVESDGRFYMTIRAEDDRGYVTVSDDGLQWKTPVAWCWDDGEPLVMSTTQQHWLPHSDALFLVYNRKAEENAKVVRWRAPLYMAEVDRASMRLIRDSEQIVLPLIGDAQNDPLHVALMGNFHTLAVTPEESWVTVGENRSRDGWKGDTLLARVRWSKPNRLVT